MSPAWVRARIVTKSTRNPRGRSYQVLYRRGGRGYRIESAGTFPLEKEARLRRDLVAGWLAAGLNPKDELAKVTAAPQLVRPLRDWAADYERSRVDYAANTAKNLTSHLKRVLTAAVANRDPTTLTVADLQGWVADNDDLAPSSLARYMTTFQLLLDFAGVDPNPARDARVKLPRVITVEHDPPTADQFLAILRAVPRRYQLWLVVLEQTGMRIGEAVSLTWDDVDEQGARFRLRSANVKTRRARWVQVPAWLMAVIAAQLPREDRTTGRPVFPGLTGNGARNTMERVCRTAGLPHFHPHDLRHRRGTIWHQDPAVSIREQMERGGWTRSDIAIDTYSHLQPLEEVPAETLNALLVMPR